MTPDPAGMAAADPANPQSWNRYAYVMNNPLNATDPLGLQSASENDQCSPNSGRPINGGIPRDPGLECGTGAIDGSDPHGPKTPAPIVVPPQSITVTAPFLSSVEEIQADIAMFISLVKSTWRPTSTKVKIISRKIGNYIPVPCGGGGFAYGGGRLTGGFASSGSYGIAAADSRTGLSKGIFADITIGEGLQAGHGTAVYADHSREGFLFVGAGEDTIIEKVSVSGYASHVSGDSLFHNQLGINVDVGAGSTAGVGGGIGLGVNTDSLTSCIDHNFH